MAVMQEMRATVAYRVPCPECGAPARVTKQLLLDSTDGPSSISGPACVNEHWLTPRTETVKREQPAVPDRDLAAAS